MSNPRKGGEKTVKTSSLRDQKNVLRWRVPNSAPIERQSSERAVAAKKSLEHIDRPRSAPSSISTTQQDKVPRKPIARPIAKSHGLNSVHKRHWMYLYENFHRSVDEMYKNCEQDFSLVECSNVLHTLELCMEDFKRLAAKIQLLSQYDKPKNIAWEETRRMSSSPPVSPVASVEEPALPWAERLKMSLSVQVGAALDTSKSANPPKKPEQSQSMPSTPTTEPHSPPTTRLMLQKLSSPELKKPSPEETKQLQDERQAKAMRKREELVFAKKEKAALTISRVKEASERHNKILAKRQLWIDERQEKAGQLHDAHIHHIKKKATTENTKVNEVVWIANQSVETRKYFHQKKLEETEVRRQELQEEKRKKRVEAMAKEEAAAERRKRLEQAKVQSVGKGGIELHKKVTRTICNCCNVEVATDQFASHVKGKKHQKALGEKRATVGSDTECVLTIPSEAPLLAPLAGSSEVNSVTELEQTQRKRAKRIKQRIAQLALSYVEPGIHPPRESPHKTRMMKFVQDLRNLLAKKSFSTMGSVLGDISRTVTSKGVLAEVDLQVYRQVGGLETIVNVCAQESNISSSFLSVLVECLSVLSLACTQLSNRLYMILTGRLVPLIDLLGRTLLTSPDAPFIPAIITLLTLHLWQSVSEIEQPIKEELLVYMIQTCLFEKMQYRLTQLHPQLDTTNPNPSPAAIFVEKVVEFLESVSATVQANIRTRPVYDTSIAGKSASSVIEVFKQTNLVGVISVLASLLLQNKPSRTLPSLPPPLPSSTWSIIFSSVKFLNNVATLDLTFLQNFLGPEVYQVEMFHLFSHFLWYCTSTQDEQSAEKRSKLLNEIILLAGYCSLQNSKAQDLFQWGNSPTILQQLCSLPFQYFSDPRYKAILFPTLVAVCFENTRNSTILQQEVSTDLLIEYLRIELLQKDDTTIKAQVPARFLLKNRVPEPLWEKAIEFFKQKLK